MSVSFDRNVTTSVSWQLTDYSWQIVYVPDYQMNERPVKNIFI